jgi:D-glycero-alpha-D-manno-heptose-7-phosphate kinase
MIISRAPVRISLGGGGTDLASYYEKFGGFLIAGAINKYVFVAANRRFRQSIRLSYSETENVEAVAEIKHAIFRHALEHVGITGQIELASIADVPANCGLGTSSTFTVALLNALHAYKRDFLSLNALAEEACHLEIDICRSPIGKQDQYMAVYGGLTCLTFTKDGAVTVEPLRISEDRMLGLESNILLFYTGIERKASDILRVQNEKSQKDDAATLEHLHRIKAIGLETRTILEGGKIDGFGEMLDLHWQAKRNLSEKISDPFIDECYDLAMKHGATGGKIMGAGGGGFFLFYCPERKGALIEVMTEKAGLSFMPCKFDLEGAKVVANLR